MSSYLLMYPKISVRNDRCVSGSQNMERLQQSSSIVHFNIMHFIRCGFTISFIVVSEGSVLSRL